MHAERIFKRHGAARGKLSVGALGGGIVGMERLRGHKMHLFKCIQTAASQWSLVKGVARAGKLFY